MSSKFSSLVNKAEQYYADYIYTPYNYIRPKRRRRIKIESNTSFLGRDNLDFQRDPKRGTKKTFRYEKDIKRRRKRSEGHFFLEQPKNNNSMYVRRRKRTYRRRPIRRRRRSYRRTYSRRYRPTRRYFRRRPYRTRRVSGKYLSRILNAAPRSRIRKSINNKRFNLGLPPLTYGKYRDFSDYLDTANQWDTFDYDTWSFGHNFHYLAYSLASTNTSRSSNTVYCCPFTCRLWVAQPRDVAITYRFIILKVMEQNPVNYAFIIPERVIADYANTTEGLYSNYLDNQIEQRPYKFKILYDKSFRKNSYGSDNAFFTMKFRIPGASVTYEDGLPNNETNNVMMFVITDAPAENATYYYGLKYRYYFTDYFGKQNY